MTALAVAVADTLLPGDGVLPAASAALGDLPGWAVAQAPLLGAVAAAAGPEGFARADAARRTRILREIEAADPAAFGAALASLLAAYCEAPSVLASLGWRDTPPQPAGHMVPEAGPDSWAMLERVRARGRIWR